MQHPGNFLAGICLLICGTIYSGNTYAQAKDQKPPLLQKWKSVELVKGGRIDAIKALGGSTVACATRGDQPGKLFISYDYGRNWRWIATPARANITCIAETGNTQNFFLLTGESEVLKTIDGGRSWQKMTKLTVNNSRDGAQASYGIVFTEKGSLLVSSTDTDGGHIYRSTDEGKTWKDVGKIGTNALYRFEQAGGRLLVNSFDGKLYVSDDDGRNWKLQTALTSEPLFATEYGASGVLLQADKAGTIFRSTDMGGNWTNAGKFKGAADDFISVGYGLVYYSTYTEGEEVYLSTDDGLQWQPAGRVPTGVTGDWLDHGVSLESRDSVIVLAGTVKGFIIRTAMHRDSLRKQSGWKRAEAKTAIDTQQIVKRSPRIPALKSGNQLPNSSFEEGSGGWSSLGEHTGWGGDLTSLYGTVVKTKSVDGDRSLQIELGPGKTHVSYYDCWPAARVVQKAPLAANIGWLTVTPGNWYTLSVYMRADRVGVPARLQQEYGLSPYYGQKVLSEKKEVTLTKEWKRYSFSMQAKSAELFIAVGPALKNEQDEAVVWIDAIQLEEGQEASSYKPRLQWEFELASTKFGNIFHLGETPKLQAGYSNRNKLAQNLVVEQELTDFFGQVISKEEKKLRLKGGSAEQFQWNLPLKKPGFYKAKYTWVEGEIKREKVFRLAIIQPYLADDALFGVNHAPVTKELGKALQQAGLKWARNWSVNWGWLEPEPGKLSFATSDQQINRELEEGYKVLPIVPPLPAAGWGSVAPDSIKDYLWYRMAYMPKEPTALMNFIQKAVHHYKPKLDYYEFLNEPVWTSFCLPGKAYKIPGADYTPSDYIGLLKKAYPTIKQAYPQAKVLGGFSAEPWRYMKEFFAEDGFNSIDILNIHNYGMHRMPEHFIPEMDTLLAMMDRHGGRKPIWITEFSYYATDDHPWLPWIAPPNHSSANLLLENEQQGADWTVRFNIIKLARGVDKIFYHQGAEGMMNEGGNNLELALITELGQPRKLYVAQAALASFLGADTKYIGSIDSPSSEELQGYAFESGKKAVLVAWLPETSRQAYTIPLPEGVKLFDVTGAEISNSRVAWLHHSPVYLVADMPAQELLQKTKAVAYNPAY
ncbi:glycosyl hydrolase [Flavihumibacter sp. UBA7668]|uniref:glycosyl hydrolase n=1 Tax=Flavihumibacter sp. UBA7668 TaxID=1946542 RepID=UPI0025C3F392|nr:glycosyl hydrolase [Flavihumibacter sp. UBA7668]